MNNPSSITSYADLVQEKQRLKLQLANAEMEIRSEFAVIKQKLKPVSTVIDFVEKLTTKDKSNPLLTTGIDIGVNLLLKNLVLRNAGWAVRLVTPFLVKNFLSHEAREHPEWMQKLTRFFKKTFSKDKEKDPPFGE